MMKTCNIAKLENLMQYYTHHLNPFQLSIAFHKETSHLIWTANQMTGFYIEYQTELKLVNNAIYPFQNYSPCVILV